MACALLCIASRQIPAAATLHDFTDAAAGLRLLHSVPEDLL